MTVQLLDAKNQRHPYRQIRPDFYVPEAESDMTIHERYFVKIRYPGESDWIILDWCAAASAEEAIEKVKREHVGVATGVRWKFSGDHGAGQWSSFSHPIPEFFAEEMKKYPASLEVTRPMDEMRARDADLHRP